MKIKRLRRFCGLFLIFSLLLSACEREAEVTQEPIKDISGTWKIVKLVRNGEDMTNRLHFNNFRVIIDKDGAYELEGKGPFIVYGEGGYTMNNPRYPFKINFIPETGTSNGRSAKLNLPIRKGKRQMELTFSLGCTENTYIYTMVRE